MIFLNSHTRSSENGGKWFTASSDTRQNSAAIANPPYPKKQNVV
ncbi:hypothetical protein [Neisseria sp. HMSC70E02]|nr:hypothetical protein [Neisseria sp. HMSC70E02]